MKKVLLVEQLKVKEVPYLGYNEIPSNQFQMDSLRDVIGEDSVVVSKVIPKGVPVIQFTYPGEVEPVYLAYTEQVEKVLNVPINSLYTQTEDLTKKLSLLKTTHDSLYEDYREVLYLRDKYNSRLKDISQASFWNRLRFLFTGDIKKL